MKRDKFKLVKQVLEEHDMDAMELNGGQLGKLFELVDAVHDYLEHVKAVREQGERGPG